MGRLLNGTHGGNGKLVKVGVFNRNGRISSTRHRHSVHFTIARDGLRYVALNLRSVTRVGSTVRQIVQGTEK